MKIFVAKLDYAVNDADLADAFSEFGEVASATVVLDKFSGRSRGFGFVEMDDDQAAQAAIDALNDTELKGRAIVVEQAEDRGERRSNRRDNRW